MKGKNQRNEGNIIEGGYVEIDEKKFIEDYVDSILKKTNKENINEKLEKAKNSVILFTKEVKKTKREIKKLTETLEADELFLKRNEILLRKLEEKKNEFEK